MRQNDQCGPGGNMTDSIKADTRTGHGEPKQGEEILEAFK